MLKLWKYHKTEWVNTLEEAQKRSISKPVLSILIVTTVIVWVAYYLLGSPSFKQENAISIYGTTIQGMSALLSVSIAVIIFRIQSLENRNQSLEQSTLNYIFQITKNTYPKWLLPCVEENIRRGFIAARYYSNRNELTDKKKL